MVAEKIVDTIKNQAPDCISVFSPVPAVAPVSFSAGHRFAHYIGAHTHTFFDWYADHPTGQTQTCGVQGDTCECADWFNAKYIILWGANPSITRIPDAHFLSEAALNGTKIVSIAPDYKRVGRESWKIPRFCFKPLIYRRESENRPPTPQPSAGNPEHSHQNDLCVPSDMAPTQPVFPD